MPPIEQTRPRLEGGVLLGSRLAAAVFTRRHVNVVRNRCTPVACDTATRALLYDLDEVDEQLRNVPRRAEAC